MRVNEQMQQKMEKEKGGGSRKEWVGIRKEQKKEETEARQKENEKQANMGI